MKKQLHFTAIFIFILLGLNTYSNSQTLNCIWANSSQQGILGGLNVVYSMATDANGNTYITGTFSSDTIMFGSIMLLKKDTTTSTSDYFIAKYDNSGNVLWAQSAGGTGYGHGLSNEDVGNGITIDNTGNIYATGSFTTDSITFGNTTLTNASNINTSNYFIVKYSPSGKVIWANEGYKNFNNSSAAAITSDNEANIYLIGSFMINSQSDTIKIGNSNIGGNGYFIAKFDSSGNVIWAKGASGGIQYVSTCSGTALTTDVNGNVTVIGGFVGDTVSFGGVKLTNDSSTYIDQMFIVKYNSSGTVLWAKSANIGTDGIGGFNGITDGGANSISTDTQGALYITGGFFGSYITFGNVTLKNHQLGNSDNMFIVKYSPSGNVVWAKNGAADYITEGLGIANDDNGHLYVTGTFDSQILTLGNIRLTGTSANNVFLAKYDTSGNALAGISAGGSGYEIDRGVAVQTDGDGNIYTTGIYSDALSFGNNHLSTVPQGVFVAKFNNTSGIQGLGTLNSAMKVYPNPTDNSTTVDFTANDKSVSIAVVNILGQPVYSEIITASNGNNYHANLNLSSLPAGIYECVIHTSSQNLTQEIFKQ